MQLSLFESHGILEFNGTVLKKDWSYQFKPGTKDIVISYTVSLTKAKESVSEFIEKHFDNLVEKNERR